MTRIRRTLAYISFVALIGVLAGCTTPAPPSEPEPPAATDPTGEPDDLEQIPHLFVVTKPAGWEAATSTPPGGQWGVVAAGDGCVLSSRGTEEPATSKDDRNDSISALETLAKERGHDDPHPTDVTLPVEFGPDPDNPSSVLEFVMDEWTTSAGTVTAAARTVTEPS